MTVVLFSCTLMTHLQLKGWIDSSTPISKPLRETSEISCPSCKEVENPWFCSPSTTATPRIGISGSTCSHVPHNVQCRGESIPPLLPTMPLLDELPKPHAWVVKNSNDSVVYMDTFTSNNENLLFDLHHHWTSILLPSLSIALLQVHKSKMVDFLQTFFLKNLSCRPSGHPRSWSSPKPPWLASFHKPRQQLVYYID